MSPPPSFPARECLSPCASRRRPTPAFPQEQSILGGPGENGGALALDGPTFVSTEGWDWIPAVRDRNSGIWQPVTLRITRSLKLGDAHIVTTFKQSRHLASRRRDRCPGHQSLHRTRRRYSRSPSIEKITVRKRVTLPPGETLVKLTPAEFPQLNLRPPASLVAQWLRQTRTLHLKLALNAAGSVSDTKDVRFGVREISYELSLLDSTGHLRRVEFTPANAHGDKSPHRRCQPRWHA